MGFLKEVATESHNVAQELQKEGNKCPFERFQYICMVKNTGAILKFATWLEEQKFKKQK